MCNEVEGLPAHKFSHHTGYRMRSEETRMSPRGIALDEGQEVGKVGNNIPLRGLVITTEVVSDLPRSQTTTYISLDT